MSEHVEIETKFDVDDTTPTPNFSLAGLVSGETKVDHLSALYVDTVDFDLTNRKMTLRRRTGGSDEGWHLKLPGDLGRREIHASLDEGSISGEIPQLTSRAEYKNPHTTEPVDGAVLGAPLSRNSVSIPQEFVSHLPEEVAGKEFMVIARIDNRRHTTLITDPESNEKAEFCDDHVASWGFGEVYRAWREWEIELCSSSGADDLARKSSHCAQRAGGTVTHSPSKLLMALGKI